VSEALKTETIQKRRGGRLFQPGVSGNPGGRPKGDVAQLARVHTTDAIKALVKALQRPKEAVPAAIALLDRGWGRPTQTIEATTNSNSLHLHLVAAQSVLAQTVLVIEAETNAVTAVVTDALPTE